MEQLLEIFAIDFELVGNLAAFFGAFIFFGVQGLKVLGAIPEGMSGQVALGLAGVLAALGVVGIAYPPAGPFISLGLGLFSAAVVAALFYESFGRSAFEQLGVQDEE